jgi:hypothetical protein
MVELEPEDELYRRLHFEIVNGDVVTSGAFKTNNVYDEQISVHIAKLLDSPHDVLRDRSSHGVGVITVADAMRLGFVVRPDPLPDDEAHALLIGENNRQKARQLAARTRVLIPPKPRPARRDQSS